MREQYKHRAKVGVDRQAATDCEIILTSALWVRSGEQQEPVAGSKHV